MNATPMTAAVNRSKSTAGFVCPRHRRKLHVLTTRAAARKIRVRYLVCPVAGCKYREVTEERPRKKAAPHA